MKRTWTMLGAVCVVVAGCNDGSDGTYGGVTSSPPGDAPTLFPAPGDTSPGDPFSPGPGSKPPQKGRTPTFPRAHQADAPPAISGGTLLVMADGDHAVAADPDRDRIYVASLSTRSLLKTLSLQAHDEPGRVAEDDAHRVHVALRRGGAVVTIDPVAGTILARRAVCPSPRGIAPDAAAGRMIVACEGGELMAVPTEPTGVPTLIARLDRDLRDVVVTGSHVYVSRFRSAEILDLTSDGTVLGRSFPNAAAVDPSAAPTLAWRMIAAPPDAPSSKPVVVHEVAGAPGGLPVGTTPGGYGAPPGAAGDCTPSIITSAVSQGDAPLVHAPTQLVLPVDIAADGASYAVVAAGNAHTSGLPQVFILAKTGGPCATTQTVLSPDGEAIALALLPGQGVLVQSREPAQLQLMSRLSTTAGLPAVLIPLSADSRSDTGHAVFHANSGSGIACASCHGEGGDDGHVWTFDPEGSRRTPSLRGTLDGTAPYHWNGEMKDMSTLADAVMTGRMNGPVLDDETKGSLQSWLFALPALPAPTGLDPAAIARGRTLFQSDATGCASCHGGARLTSSLTVDVGTGDRFQVPSLVGVGARAPFLHNGCAATLTDRFGSCGGATHGDISTLTNGDVADLVTYLQTL